MGKTNTTAKAKVNATDPGQKSHDGVSTKAILDSVGNPIRDLGEARKEAVADLVALMQGSVNEHISSYAFSTKFDLAYEPINSISAYGQSLKTAVEAILEAHPSMGDADGSDDDLRYLIEICQAVLTGTERAKGYLDAARIFSQDLDKINVELQTQIQRLFI